MVLIVALRKRWPPLFGKPAEQAVLGRLSPGLTGVAALNLARQRSLLFQARGSLLPTVRIVRCISNLRDGSRARPTLPVSAGYATHAANSGVIGARAAQTGP